MKDNLEPADADRTDILGAVFLSNGAADAQAGFADAFEFATTAVEPEPPAPALADLVIQAAQLSTTVLNPGDSFSALWDVANIGTATAKVSRTGIYLSRDNVLSPDDVFLDFNTNVLLAPGAVDREQTDSFRLPASLAPGQYFVALVADSGGVVDELDETNNSVFFQITVADPAEKLRPDLVIQNAQINTTGFITGQVIRINWEVANVGTVASVITQVGIYLSTDSNVTTDDLLLDVNAATALIAGAVDFNEKAAFKLPDTLPSGTYFVGLIADRLSFVNELSEANNATVAFKIDVVNPSDQPRPDLVIQNAQISGTTFRAGDVVDVRWDVANIGGGAARVSHTGVFLSRDATFDGSDKLVDNNANVALAAGGLDLLQTDSFRLDRDLEPGTYFVALVADYRERVVESIEANNASTFFEINVI